ncbi:MULTISPECIES: DUF1127 domain-containing protein [Shimia]|uniref:DUF1127 domain-containing protein n=1 Tax=Shimia TaxID=573139 RepID=UPI001FB50D36|nr:MULTISPECIES: DUF1127 domain-containing protein [Shimia]MDV4146067.1 DUF1127 domain-containing protein [Shimia sp. FJ5]
MALATDFIASKHGFTDRLSALATDLVERLRKARAFSRAYNELAALPDAQLRDMGLNRSMIRRIAYQAAYEN